MLALVVILISKYPLETFVAFVKFTDEDGPVDVIVTSITAYATGTNKTAIKPARRITGTKFWLRMLPLN